MLFHQGGIGDDTRKEMDTIPTAQNINATDQEMKVYRVKDVKRVSIILLPVSNLNWVEEILMERM